jgi:hypothetical protein
MKTFAKLAAKGQSAQISALAEALDSAMLQTSRWRRETTKERWMRERGGAPLRCYARDPSVDRPGVLVWLDVSGDTLRITNITPRQAGSLDVGAYNAVVREIYEVLAPIVQSMGSLDVQFDDGEDALRKRVSASVARLLEDFAHGANRETGADHPADRDRWLEFVLASHREGSELGGELLARWLREEHQFPYDVAGRLADEYEHARELLTRYDQDAA